MITKRIRDFPFHILYFVLLNPLGVKMSLYRRLLRLVKPYWGKLGLAMICMVCLAGLTAAQAFFLKPVINGVFERKDVLPPYVKDFIIKLHLGDLLLKKDMEMLNILPFFLICLFLVKGIFNYGQAYLMNFVGLRIIRRYQIKTLQPSPNPFLLLFH